MKTINRLIRSGESANVLNSENETPLHIAVRNGRAGAVRALLANGADPNLQNIWNETALSVALMNYRKKIDLEIVELLFDKAADPNSLIWSDKAAFVGGSQEVAVFEKMKSSGLETTSALLVVILKRGTKQSAELLMKGYEGMKLDSKAYNALLAAVRAGRYAVADAVDFKSYSKGRDVLSVAEWDRNFNRFKALLKRGADPNGRTNSGSTLLLGNIVHRKLTNYVKLLIEYGADVNAAEGYSKRTALHMAVKAESCEMIRLLLDNGAKLDAKDKWGHTPVDWAKNMKASKMLDCINNYLTHKD